MGLKHPKINFHWRQKISVGWARCSWTWRKISALSEIGVHWNSIYDLKGTVSMSVSPRANSYTSRLQRVCSKRPKGTHMSPSSTYLYFLQFKRYHIRGYMTLPIHCCSVLPAHWFWIWIFTLPVPGEFSENSPKRYTCLVCWADMRSKKGFLQNSKQSWKNWVHPVIQWLQLFKPALSPITWSSVGLYQSLILLWLTFGPRFLAKWLQFIEVLQEVIS